MNPPQSSDQVFSSAVCSVCQATLNVIRNVVLEVLDSNRRNRLLEESGSRASGPDSTRGSPLLRGEAELAYLTHEGLFISDALNEAAAQDPNSRTQPSPTEARGSDSGTDAGGGTKEQSVT